MTKMTVQVGMLAAKFARIAIVQFLGFIEFCMAQPRRVCSHGPDSPGPLAAGLQLLAKMLHVRAVDCEVGRRFPGRFVHG